MLTQLSLLTLTALAVALPTDLLSHLILPALPRYDVHSHTLSLRSSDPLVVEGYVPGVFICTGEHWTGICYWEGRVPGHCHKYQLGKTSSFGPDMDVVCGLYTTPDYTGTNTAVAYPGMASGLKGNVQS